VPLTTPETNRLLTIPETAEALRVSRVTVYRLVKDGSLPAHRVGQQLRVDEVELRDYVHAGRVQKNTP
jgi:putative molybdopterin biosynthesis protein